MTAGVKGFSMNLTSRSGKPGRVVAMTLKGAERALHGKHLECIGEGQSALKRQAEFANTISTTPSLKGAAQAGALRRDRC